MEREQATELIHNLLRGMLSKKASDLFITAGFPPAFKMDGKLTPVSNQALTPTHTQELARSIMNDRQAAEFEASHECNFAISPPGIGRFRVNVFMQQQRVGMVLRTITTKIPDFDEMGLPQVLKEKGKEELVSLKEPEKTQLFRSIFRVKHDDQPRNRALSVLTNVFFHLHPAKINRDAVRYSYTWGMGGITFYLCNNEKAPLLRSSSLFDLSPARARSSGGTRHAGRADHRAAPARQPAPPGERPRRSPASGCRARTSRCLRGTSSCTPRHRGR